MLAKEVITRKAELNQQVHILYQNHHSWLYQWLLKRLNCSYRAADLAHDTFIRLLSRENPVSIQQPRAYLSTIAQGMVSNFYRRQAVEKAYSEALAVMPEAVVPSVETTTIMLETLVEIDQRLNGLKPEIKRAFLLSQIDGLRQSDIALQLGVSIATVKRYIVKALVLCCFDDE